MAEYVAYMAHMQRLACPQATLARVAALSAVLADQMPAHRRGNESPAEVGRAAGSRTCQVQRRLAVEEAWRTHHLAVPCLHRGQALLR